MTFQVAEATKPRIGDPGFDPEAHEARWGALPASMILVEYWGDGDPAFGGHADDRVVLTSGRIQESTLRKAGEVVAEFPSVASAHEAALKIPNRRAQGLLGVVPTWSR